MIMLEQMLIGAFIGWLIWFLFQIIDAAPWRDAADQRYVNDLRQREYDQWVHHRVEDAKRHDPGCECELCIWYCYHLREQAGRKVWRPPGPDHPGSDRGRS
jgi:hypothetical protein